MRGLLKTGNFSGRATRSEFWWFCPLGLVIPAVVALFAPPEVNGFQMMAVKLGLVGLASVPLASAATRRVQDAGRHGIELWVCIKPTLMIVLCGWLVNFGLFAMSTVIYLFVGILIFIPALPALIGYAIVAPGLLGIAIGLLVKSSTPGPNRYGPPPEVAA